MPKACPYDAEGGATVWRRGGAPHPSQLFPVSFSDLPPTAVAEVAAVVALGVFVDGESGLLDGVFYDEVAHHVHDGG